MKIETARMSCVLLLVGILAACGGAGTPGSAPAANNVSYSGRVVDENGAPVSGIEITLENRQSNRFVRVITQAGGRFSANVEAGVYDIMFDDPGEEKYITLQNTAIDLQQDSSAEVQIKSKMNVASNLLTGSVTDMDGSPGSHRKLVMVPLVARYVFPAGNPELPPLEPQFDMPRLKAVQTDSQGKFALPLDKEWEAVGIDFDLKVLAKDAGDFDFSKLEPDHVFSSLEMQEKYYAELRAYLRESATEIVDIEMPKGSMHVNLSLGAKTQNLLNSIGQPILTPEARRQQSEMENRSIDMNELVQSAFLKIKNYSINGIIKLLPSVYALGVGKDFDVVFQRSTARKGGVGVALVNGMFVPDSNRIIYFSQGEGGVKRRQILKLSDTEYKLNVSAFQILMRTNFSINRYQEAEEEYNLSLYQFSPASCTFIVNSSHENLAVKSDSGNMHYENDRVEGTRTYNIKMSIPAGSYLSGVRCEDPSPLR